MSAELLRQSLLGIQAHAAGMHANAEMALRILGELRTQQQAGKRSESMYNGQPAQHYGEPDPAEMERHLSAIETGGSSPAPAQGGEPSAQE